MGTWKGAPCPHILPPEDWEKNLWPGIRSESEHSLTRYIAGKIQPHTYKHHLTSSWVLCANLYFPFRRSQRDMGILAAFLREHVAPEIATVEGIELEFEGEGILHPSKLLGEIGGGRGMGQTSPDAAFKVRTNRDGRGLILTESKFTERWFGRCPAFRPHKKMGRRANPDSTRCLDVTGLLASPKTQCHQHAWERRYWDHLTLDQSAVHTLRCCPAAFGGYQLFRQQALAEGIARSGQFDLVVSCVAYDERNEPLVRSLRGAGMNNFVDEWNRLFKGKAGFRTFTHQRWAAWVRKHDTLGRWADWSEYIRNRYGY